MDLILLPGAKVSVLAQITPSDTGEDPRPTLFRRPRPGTRVYCVTPCESLRAGDSEGGGRNFSFFSSLSFFLSLPTIHRHMKARAGH